MPSSTATTILCRLRGYPVPDTPEERVRQRVILQLFALGYPWHRLRCEVTHPALGRLAGRADLVIGLDEATSTAEAIIECKAQVPTEADVRQVLAYARAFRALCWTVTDGTVWRCWTACSPDPSDAFPNCVHLAELIADSTLLRPAL